MRQQRSWLNAEKLKAGLHERDRMIRALKLALENQLTLNGAGTSDYARSQPSDACEIELWKAHAEGAWEDLERSGQRGKLWKRLAKKQRAEALQNHLDQALADGREIVDLRVSLADTQAELERRTAWSNEQLRSLESELQFVRSQRDDNENAWQAEKQKREAAEAEVARLRAADKTDTEAIDTLTSMRATAARSAEQWHDKYEAERAAHESTKAKLRQARHYAVSCSRQSQEDSARREAAEQRVAELERERDVLLDKWQDKTTELVTALDALSAAREHVGRALAYLTNKDDVESTPGHAIGDAVTELRAWGRAHPESATPAAEAKAEAEPPGAVELMRIERELARAEKERET